jgi:hypothetical protein
LVEDMLEAFAKDKRGRGRLKEDGSDKQEKMQGSVKMNRDGEKYMKKWMKIREKE